MTLTAKDPDQPAEYGIDFHDQFVTEALRRTFFAAARILFFPRDTGWYYEVTTAGKSGQNYPDALPRTAGTTVIDGSCVLTCRHPTGILPTISSAAWTLPTGITQSSNRTDGLVAYITLTGGTDGVDYDIICTLTPSTGNPVDKTITVKVRAQ